MGVRGAAALPDLGICLRKSGRIFEAHIGDNCLAILGAPVTGTYGCLLYNIARVFMENWAIFVATLVGPIVAVCITLWYQDHSSSRNTRLVLFATMMRLRSHPTNPEFVGALNVVPVFFSKFGKVVEQYKRLLGVYADTGWNSKDEATLLALNNRVRDQLALLLSEMGKAVKHPFEHLDIMRGVYHPQGWIDDQMVLNDIRNGVRALMKGEYALPVVVIPAEAMAGQPTEDATAKLAKPDAAPPAKTAKKPA